MARITHSPDMVANCGTAHGRRCPRACVQAGKGLPGVLLRLAGVSLLALSLGGCFLPKDGPSLREMLRPAAKQPPKNLNYRLVDVNAETLEQLTVRDDEVPGHFTDYKPPRELRLGKGDVVSVTIFEAAAGGLFIPTQAGVRPGNFVELPRQSIDKDGQLVVPYAGAIKAAGLTIPELQSLIVDKLRPRAIEPQVIVTVQDKRSSEVSVLGEVNEPTRYALSDAPDRILDGIARGGGPKMQGFETYVTLQRGDQSITVSFDQLVNTPSNNIFLRPGDTVYVRRHQRSYNVIGASGQPGRFVFDTETITVADAVARAGGLADRRANAAAVFMYRYNPGTTNKLHGANGIQSLPTIYRFDMRSATGFFYATKVPMRNQDFIYIANAPSVELNKFLEIVNLVTNAGYNVSQMIAVGK